MRQVLALSLRRALVLNLLAGALLIALAVPLIRLLLERGAFSPRHTDLVALALICYTPGLLALSAQQFLARGFYAIGDTRTPTVAGALGIAVFFVSAFVALGVARAGGTAAPLLAACSSLAVGVIAIAMGRALGRKLGGWDGGRTGQVLARGGAASVAAFVAAFGLASVVPTALGAFLCGAVAGTFVFVLVGSALKLEEISAVTDKLGKVAAKLSRKTKG
jgi:putative peptidoglycan lipid II flippase